MSEIKRTLRDACVKLLGIQSPSKKSFDIGNKICDFLSLLFGGKEDE